MKKSVLAIAALAVIGAGYPAAAFFTGKSLEERLSQEKTKDFKIAKVHITNQKYERGIFTSKQESTIEIDFDSSGYFPSPKPHYFQEVSNANEQSEEMTSEQELAMREQMAQQGNEMAQQGNEGEEAYNEYRTYKKEPLKIQVINHITHGPIPGAPTVAAAKINTEFVMTPEVQAEIKKIFGDKKFLELQSLLNYGGGGTIKISSPAVSYASENNEKINWKGLSLNLGYSKDGSELDYVFKAGGIESDKVDLKESIKVGEIIANGKAKILFPDSYLYTGKGEASIKGFSVTGGDKPFEVKEIKLESHSELKGELLNNSIKFTMNDVLANKENIGNLNLAYSLNNLHAKSVNGFYATLDKMKSSAMSAEGYEQIQKEIKGLLQEMVKHNPIMVLDDLSLTTKEGKLAGKGKVQFVDVKPEDFDMPLALLGKLEAEANFSLTEALIKKLNASTQSKNTDPETAKMMDDIQKAQLEEYVKMGYVKREGGNLTTQLAWKQNALTINGKPYSKQSGSMPEPLDP